MYNMFIAALDAKNKEENVKIIKSITVQPDSIIIECDGDPVVLRQEQQCCDEVPTDSRDFAPQQPTEVTQDQPKENAMEPEIVTPESPATRWPYNGQWSTWEDNEGMTWDQYIANDPGRGIHIMINIAPERDAQRYSFIRVANNKTRYAVEFKRYFPAETALEAALSNVPAVIAALEALS